jgi:SOS-response transcriptional repressor LexA
MERAGDGDPHRHARVLGTVVARFDDSDTSPEEGDATLKTFKRVGGHVWLLPENPPYDPIPGDKAKILGKVVYVSRTLRWGLGPSGLASLTRA